MLLPSLLEERAAATPERIALVCDEQRISFADLDARANRLARALIARGIVRGDRVAMCLPNGPEAVVTIFGALKAGAVVVPIHPATKPDKLVTILADSGARGVIIGGDKLGAIEPVLAQLAALVVVGTSAHASGAAMVSWEDALAVEEPTPPAPSGAIELDLAFLLYTSGSTGVPKGVMHTHRSIATITRTITGYLGLAPEDVVLSVLPLSFGYGLTQLLTTLSAGGVLVLERSIAYPRQVLARMAEQRATGIAVVPTIAALLLRHDLAAFDLSSLRYLTNAGAAIAPTTIAALRAQLPQVRIFSMYGQTECIRTSYLDPAEIDARPRSVGKGLPGQEHWVADEEERRLPPGQTGELVVRGAHLMSGYWNRPEETARALRPGPLPGERVLHTGDLFEIDHDGYLYFVGRVDDVIKSRGEKVIPREVEEVLASFAGVREAAVIGVPDPLLGAAIQAFVVPDPGVQLEARALLRHCADRLDDHAIPRVIELIGELPRTPNSKIDRQALRRRREEAA